MKQSLRKYVTTWGNAISIADRKPENYAKDLTLRYPIRPMFDGERIKITLDNFCGTEPVTISQVSVCVCSVDRISVSVCIWGSLRRCAPRY